MEQTVITGDGSSTIFRVDLNESYHSRHGAISESRHVFIETGLRTAFLKFGLKVQVLEMGFGTGLNALLTMQEARKQGMEVWYTAVELFPVSPDLLNSLGYATASGFPDDALAFHRMHDLPYNVAGEISGSFVLDKRLVDFRDFSEDPGRYHVVYFDAFPPKVQPELWTPEVFARMYTVMIPGGVLVTYSSKTEVRLALQECGFVVEKVKGPPGKREMIRAFRPE